MSFESLILSKNPDPGGQYFASYTVVLCAGVKTEAAEQEAIIPGLGGGKDASSPFATALERILDKVGESEPRTLYLPRPMKRTVPPFSLCGW
jgi:hypothetical protein